MLIRADYRFDMGIEFEVRVERLRELSGEKSGDSNL